MNRCGESLPGGLPGWGAAQGKKLNVPEQEAECLIRERASLTLGELHGFPSNWVGQVPPSAPKFPPTPGEKQSALHIC